MEQELDLQGSRRASEEAWDRLTEFSEALPKEVWPAHYRGHRYLNASVIQRIVQSAPPGNSFDLVNCFH